MNILTIDVEEWFHLLDFDATRSEAEWRRYPARIHENVDRLLRLLDENHASATFFVIGWIAKQYPEVVRRIAERYEVGSHTMNHQLVWQQSPAAFREDLASSVKLLEDITGRKVRCFRAPGFSIRESEGWAFEAMAECGIEMDSSVFPARHAHGGIPAFGEPRPAIVAHGGIRIKEFPVSFKTLLGHHVVYSGGGYFRLCPELLLRRWTERQGDYLLAYLHPRDLDADQPVLPGLPWPRRFKSYVGLRHAEGKLARWLAAYPFVDLATADSLVDWSSATEVYL